MSQLLEVADFVKFAKLTPLPDVNQNMMTFAYLFVNETTPVEAVVPVTPVETKGKEVATDDLNDKKEDNQL